MELLLLLLLWAGPRGHSGTVHVRGTVTKQGTYRQPHVRTAPDHWKQNNWSTKGNANPYTGKRGSKDPYKPRK